MAITDQYRPVIGLEVHAQLLTDSKIFCACRNGFGEPPNSLTCPVCLGLPGALPVLNKKAVEYAVRMVAAVGGEVHRRSSFARKNYFYPDLPKGYQISQYDEPLGTGGEIHYRLEDGSAGSCSITRIHLEEDAGKSLHPEGTGAHTRIDLNRCGTPLIEIVSDPDLSTPLEAYAYLVQLKQILQYIEVCSGDMEKGHLRCDANVSVRRANDPGPAVRTELKNMNSFRGVRRALACEIDRQIGILENGGQVEQVTMLWDESRQVAEPMRAKEDSPDYRYFPEPDLMPLVIDEDWLADIVAGLPELPEQRHDRFVSEFGLRDYDAAVLTENRPLADYFEAVIAAFDDPRLAANFIMTELLAYLKESKLDLSDCVVTAADLAALLAQVRGGRVSVKAAKECFRRMTETGESAGVAIEKLGLAQISDPARLDEYVSNVLDKHPAQVAAYRDGKEAVLTFLVGQVMSLSKGRANPQLVNKILKDKLDG